MLACSSGVNDAVKVSDEDMLTALGSLQPLPSSPARGEDQTAAREVEAFPNNCAQSLGGKWEGALRQSGWDDFNGHGPCGIWPFCKGSHSTVAARRASLIWLEKFDLLPESVERGCVWV